MPPEEDKELQFSGQEWLKKALLFSRRSFLPVPAKVALAGRAIFTEHRPADRNGFRRLMAQGLAFGHPRRRA
jgi:hypothetical protein